MTVTQLGEALFLEKSTASRLAKALMQKDLVRRRAPRADGRIVILQVTEAGRRLARKILNDLADEYRDLLDDFEPEVGAALPRLLDRLTESIKNRGTPRGPSCC
jgi:DNA-binding MarR family transcriptional regulator